MAQNPSRDPAEFSPPESLLTVLDNLNARSQTETPQRLRAISTGFHELDSAIGGGMRPGQLILVSGRAGIGKTALTLQMARNVAASGHGVCLYICYEHPTDYLLARLISMESVDFAQGAHGDGLRYAEIMSMLGAGLSPTGPRADFLTVMNSDRRGARALKRIVRYGQRLLLVKGSSYTTNVRTIANMVREITAPGGIAAGQPVVVFVDYLQKIASTTPHTDEVARNVAEVEALKELALGEQLVVVAIAAADEEGMKAPRLYLQHLMASATLAYESDVIIVMNEKYEIVDRRQIEYNAHQAEQFHNYVVMSLEKNRFSAGRIELEARKVLQYSMFGQDMRRVNDKLL